MKKPVETSEGSAIQDLSGREVEKHDPSRRSFIQRGSALSAMAAVGGTAMSTLAPVLHAQQQQEQPAAKYGIEGYIAPEISLDYWIDADGKDTTFSIEKARGKWVFLKFFQNWCPGCHSSGFPTLKAVCDEFYGHPEVEIAGVQTVFEGFSTNTQEKVRELQLRYEIPAVMGHDPGNPGDHVPSKTMIEYRTGGTPWLVLISPDGGVVFNHFHVDRNKLIEYLKEQLA